MNWKVTNSIEHHFQIAGRTLGKVHYHHKCKLWFASVRMLRGRLVSWGRLTPIGTGQRTPKAARGIVERFVIERIEK